MGKNGFQANPDNSAKLRPKNRMKKIFANKTVITSLIILLLFIVLEFTTDFIEIIIGSVIDLTNPLRPQSGTIWDLYNADRRAANQVLEISSAVPDGATEKPDISNLSQLREKLEQDGTLLISSDNFLDLYNQMPNRFSTKVISPFDLLKLTHSDQWVWTKLVKSENNINIYFFDGDKQLIMDTYPPMTVLYDVSTPEQEKRATLDSLEMYRGRTISRDKFFETLDNLSSNTTKYQLINDPFQLIKWDKSIRRVGISRYITPNFTVNIGFEVKQGIYTEIYTFEASELAAGYFIAKLNELYPGLNFEFPESTYRGYQNY